MSGRYPQYTQPGSNWRPSACWADVIATRPWVLDMHGSAFNAGTGPGSTLGPLRGRGATKCERSPRAATAFAGCMVRPRTSAQALAWPIRRHSKMQPVVRWRKYTQPGSKWRPSACGADVIATRPQVLRFCISAERIWQTSSLSPIVEREGVSLRAPR